MNKILITGGNGFLGRHVVNAFNSTTHRFRLLTPSSQQLDVLNYMLLRQYCRDWKPEVILHLSAKCGGILANKNSPADFIHDNTQMGLNIFEVARSCKIEYVYTLGSVCAYPKHCPIPFKEDDIWNGYPEETNAPYGISKRTLLMLAQTYRQQYGIKGAHLIPVNLYGALDNFNPTNSHVIPALIRKFVEAKETDAPEVKCWGTGKATREFLYAPDCAKAIVQAVLTGFDHPDPINLGAGTDISIYDLAHATAKLVEYAGDIVFDGSVSDGQPKRLLDVSRAKQLLNWTATTKLQDGLKETIEWYKQNRSF